MNSIGGNAYPNDHGHEPTEVQLALMDRLIDEKLDLVECAPAWSLFHDDDSLQILISRNSQCLYSDGNIVKREIDNLSPPSAKDFRHHEADEVVVRADLRDEDARTRGSAINIRVTDDGVVNAYLGTAQGTEDDPADREGAYIRAEATGNEAMVDVTTGRAIAELAEYVGSLNWRIDSDSPLSNSEADRLLQLVVEVQKGLKKEGWDERFSDEEAAQVANRLLATCTAQGRPFCVVGKAFATADHSVSIEIDPFDTSYLGKDVIKSIGAGPRGGGDELAKPHLYYMNDGRIIYTSVFLPSGPDADYSKITPAAYDYERIVNAEIRPATFDDFATFLAAMQEV